MSSTVEIENPRTRSYGCNRRMPLFWSVFHDFLAMIAYTMALFIERFVYLLCWLFGIKSDANERLNQAIVPLNLDFLESLPKKASSGTVLVDGVVVETAGVRNEDGGAGKGAIFIFFPGNPGNALFYEEFLEEVVKASKGSISYGLCPSWACHSEATSRVGMDATGLRVQAYPGAFRALSLEEQVSWAVMFTEKVVESCKGVSIVLGGHSIGAWMALRVGAVKSIRPHVQALALPFPTIEHLGASLDGRRLFAIMEHYRSVLDLLFTSLSHLPQSYREFLAPLGLPRHPAKCGIRGVASLCAPGIAHAALTMGRDEMCQVLDLDDKLVQLIQDLGSHVAMYYGIDDPWNLQGDPARMKKRFPKAAIRECDRGWKHAVTLSHEAGIHLGKRIGTWIHSKDPEDLHT